MDAKQNIEDLSHQGKSWEGTGKKMRLGYLGIPLGIAAAVAKHPKTGIGLGLGGSAIGYMGERGVGYGRGLQTISKHLHGENPSQREWDSLVMNNPSGSLMAHVHPEHRKGLAKKWREEYDRFHGLTSEKTAFWAGFMKQAGLFGSNDEDKLLDDLHGHYSSMSEKDKAHLDAAAFHDPVGHGMHKYYQMRHLHLINQHRLGKGSAMKIATDHINRVNKLEKKNYNMDDLHKAGILDHNFGF